MNAFLRKVATVCVAFLLCASMGTIAFANDLPIYSEWAKAEVSAAENEGLLPFEMYDDCRRALHRDWATACVDKETVGISNGGYTHLIFIEPA